MHMNKLIGRMVLAMALAGFCVASAPAQTRIATIDGKRVINGYWKTKEAMAALKDRREDLLKELKGLSEDVKKGEDEYKKLIDDANDPAVSDEERAKRKKAAETKLKAISELKDRAREFDRNASANLNEQAQRMSERIDEKVRAAVGALAKLKGYALVLDIAARGLENKSVVVYAKDDSEDDLTADVLKQLNTDAPAETSKPAAKPEEKKEQKK
jgi:Skp family chaperone for outer membrane proteins